MDDPLGRQTDLSQQRPQIRRSVLRPGERRRRASSLTSARPWVGVRFLRSLLVAVPIAIVMWLGIAWAIAQLFG